MKHFCFRAINTETGSMSNENTATTTSHSKKWFHEEHEAKFNKVSMFLVWWEMILCMHLSAGGWVYLYK